MNDQTNAQTKLVEIVKAFDTGMLITRTPEGTLHARPMAIAAMGTDGEVTLVSDARSSKLDELRTDHEVSMTFQGRLQFASLAGSARVVDDRALAARVWKDAWRVWFPGGAEDPNLRLITVTASRGEYWNNAGTNGISYAFQAAKAVATGTTPATTQSQNAKIVLGH